MPLTAPNNDQFSTKFVNNVVSYFKQLKMQETVVCFQAGNQTLRLLMDLNLNI